MISSVFWYWNYKLCSNAKLQFFNSFDFTFNHMQVTSLEASPVARCRRVYAHAHDYHINSISNNRSVILYIEFFLLYGIPFALCHSFFSIGCFGYVYFLAFKQKTSNLVEQILLKSQCLVSVLSSIAGCSCSLMNKFSL